MRPDLDALVAEYEATMTPTTNRGRCKICGSEYREFVDLMMQRGAGGANLSIFLERKFGLKISESSLRRHKRVHLGTEEVC